MDNYKLLTSEMIRNNLNVGDLIYNKKTGEIAKVYHVGHGRVILEGNTEVHPNTHGNNFYLVPTNHNLSGGRKSKMSRKSKKSRKSRKSRKARKSRKM